MSELAIVAIILLAVSIIVWVIVRIYNVRRAAMAVPQPWVVRQQTIRMTGRNNPNWPAIESGVRVYLFHPGEPKDEPIDIGIAVCSAPDFEDALIGLRVKGEDQAAVLNRGLNP